MKSVKRTKDLQSLINVSFYTTVYKLYFHTIYTIVLNIRACQDPGLLLTYVTCLLVYPGCWTKNVKPWPMLIICDCHWIWWSLTPQRWPFNKLSYAVMQFCEQVRFIGQYSYQNFLGKHSLLPDQNSPPRFYKALLTWLWRAVLDYNWDRRVDLLGA